MTYDEVVQKLTTHRRNGKSHVRSVAVLDRHQRFHRTEYRAVQYSYDNIKLITWSSEGNITLCHPGGHLPDLQRSCMRRMLPRGLDLRPEGYYWVVQTPTSTYPIVPNLCFSAANECTNPPEFYRLTSALQVGRVIDAYVPEYITRLLRGEISFEAADSCPECPRYDFHYTYSALSHLEHVWTHLQYRVFPPNFVQHLAPAPKRYGGRCTLGPSAILNVIAECSPDARKIRKKPRSIAQLVEQTSLLLLHGAPAQPGLRPHYYRKQLEAALRHRLYKQFHLVQ